MYAVFDSKLNTVYPDTRFATPPRHMPLTRIEQAREAMRWEHVRRSQKRAKDFLNDLASAITRSTGGGVRGRYPRLEVASMLDAEEAIVRSACDFLRSRPHVHASTLAAKTGIDLKDAEYLVKHPRQWKRVAAKRVARWFRTKNWKRIKEIAAEGRKLRSKGRRRVR